MPVGMLVGALNYRVAKKGNDWANLTSLQTSNELCYETCLDPYMEIFL